MTKTKIKTTLTHRAGRVVSFGNLGKVKFDENCQSEVENELVEFIQRLDDSIKLVNENSIKLFDFEDDKTVGDELDLSKMTLKQLQEVARESNFLDSEWIKLNKAQMVKYMEGKLEEE